MTSGEIPEIAARGFTSGAEVYERARPNYPEGAVAWLCERLGIRDGRTVLDVGAGTGKLTRQLVPSGARIVAVEPVDAMRERLVAAVPEAEALAGAAEALPLPDASIDAVVCAQAFHWFRADEALPEIHRVLRPGGGLGLIWNSRDLSDPLQARLDAILGRYQGEARRHFDDDAEQVLDASPLFGRVEYRMWPLEQSVALGELLEVVASRSYVASLDPESRAAVLQEVRAAVAGLGEPIVLRYDSDVFVVDRLP